MDSLTDDAILSLTSYLCPRDLVSLALACSRFGRPSCIISTARKKYNCYYGNDGICECDESQLSLMDEVSRQRVLALTRCDQWKYSDILVREEGESWISVDYRLHLLMGTSLVFHRFIGNGIAYVQRKNLSHVEIHERAVSSGDYPLGTSVAVCQKVMSSGRHYAEFTVTREGFIKVGIMRPIQDWDTQQFKTMNLANNQDFMEFCMQQNCVGYEGGHHCWFSNTLPDSYGRRNFLRTGDEMGLVLDIDDGTVSVYKNGRAIHASNGGFQGHYCWAVSIINGVYRGAVKVESAPFPEQI